MSRPDRFIQETAQSCRKIQFTDMDRHSTLALPWNGRCDRDPSPPATAPVRAAPRAGPGQRSDVVHPSNLVPAAEAADGAAGSGNALIERLPPAQRASLLAHCRRVPLGGLDVLWRPDRPARFVHFPAGGAVSLVVADEGLSALEVAMVGREGMLGIHAVLGVATPPVRPQVQVEGWAWRADAETFRRHLDASAELKRLLDRYVAVRMNQLATFATCLHGHEVGPRLARWLLMTQDRAGSDRFRTTQENLARMLGVRRASVTEAAGLLQRRGVIAYRRGDLQVLDRPALERAACACYRQDLIDYGEVLG